LFWVQAPAPQTPVVEPPVVRPHTPLSQSVSLWQVCPLVMQLPAADPVPKPQALLSQSPFL